jgi:hypothetical protein
MASPARWLTRPSTGFLVLAVLAVILGLIVYAAYHGSDAAVASECGPAHGLLQRTLTDANTTRSQVTIDASATPAVATAVTRDDNDINNFINGEQHPNSGFDGAVLPLADALGRVATDLQPLPLPKPVPSGTVSDVNGLASAASTAAQYCGISG